MENKTILEKIEKMTHFTSMSTFSDKDFKKITHDIKISNGYYVIRTVSGRKLIAFFNGENWLTPVYHEEVVDIYKGSYNLN